MNLRFYLDEDVDTGLADALKRRSVDAVTTKEAGNRSHSDHRQLIYSKERNRIIITHNTRDFVVLHKRFLKKNLTHPGIIVSAQLPVGTLLKRVMKFWASSNAEDIQNRLIFLSNWR